MIAIDLYYILRGLIWHLDTEPKPDRAAQTVKLKKMLLSGKEKNKLLLSIRTSKAAFFALKSGKLDPSAALQLKSLYMKDPVLATVTSAHNTEFQKLKKICGIWKRSSVWYTFKNE